MNDIYVGVYEEHQLLNQAICNLCAEIERIKIVLSVHDKEHLLEQLKLKQVNILIFNVNFFNQHTTNLLLQINIKFPRTSIIILSTVGDEETIRKCIKAGTKGFLSKDSTKNDLREAVYTVRNGFDYFSKSIAHLIINKYITSIKNEDNTTGNLASLSLREVEILKFWGNNLSNADISELLSISVRTVESHKNHIMQKLNLKTAVELVKFAIKNNIIEL